MGNKDKNQKYTRKNTVKFGKFRNSGTKKGSQLLFKRKI